MKHSVRFLTAAAAVAMVGLASIGLAQATELTDYSWAVLKDNPKFYWTFNEAGATDAAQDIVRYRDAAALAPQYDATRGASLTANLGQAAVLDGNEDIFATADLSEGWVSSAWAIEMWVKSDGTDGGQYLLNNMGDTGAGDWPAVIFDYTADTPELWTHGGRTGTAMPTITDTDWHHLVFTAYGNGTHGVADRIDVAMDGTVYPSAALGSGINTLVNLQGVLHVGNHTSGSPSAFSGAIDEVAFYELSGMTEAEVAAKTADIAGHYALAQNAPAANVAFVDPAGISYQWVAGAPAGGGNYADSTGRELVDGQFATSGDLMAESVGYQSTTETFVDLVFDLGKSADLDSIWIDYTAGNGKWGVRAPVSVEISFSDDGVTFGDTMVFDDFSDDEASSGGWDYFAERRLQAELGGVEASYVKLHINKEGTFAFLSEVQFLEAVPEPGMLSMLLIGLIGLVAARRR